MTVTGRCIFYLPGSKKEAGAVWHLLPHISLAHSLFPDDCPFWLLAHCRNNRGAPQGRQAAQGGRGANRRRRQKSCGHAGVEKG